MLATLCSPLRNAWGVMLGVPSASSRPSIWVRRGLRSRTRARWKKWRVRSGRSTVRVNPHSSASRMPASSYWAPATSRTETPGCWSSSGMRSASCQSKSTSSRRRSAPLTVAVELDMVPGPPGSNEPPEPQVHGAYQPRPVAPRQSKGRARRPRIAICTGGPGETKLPAEGSGARAGRAPGAARLGFGRLDQGGGSQLAVQDLHRVARLQAVEVGAEVPPQDELRASLAAAIQLFRVGSDPLHQLEPGQAVGKLDPAGGSADLEHRWLGAAEGQRVEPPAPAQPAQLGAERGLSQPLAAAPQRRQAVERPARGRQRIQLCALGVQRPLGAIALVLAHRPRPRLVPAHRARRKDGVHPRDHVAQTLVVLRAGIELAGLERLDLLDVRALVLVEAHQVGDLVVGAEDSELLLRHP